MLSVLRRRLTDEDIAEILELSVATAHEHPQRHVDYDTLRKIIAGVLHEQPTDEDIERVTDQLVAGGWPVVGADEEPGDIETDGTAASDDKTGDNQHTGTY